MHCYNIPTIDPDLRHEETILQAINVFEFLNQVIDDVFGKVNARIEANRVRLEQIDGRIEKVNGDVARLRETKEAIVIYSPCRYPGADLDPTVLPTFTPANGIRMKENDFVLQDKTYVPTHSYQEKIQFYHVKSSTDRHRIYPFDGGVRGGGKLHEGVQYLDSILLFNSKDFAVDYSGAVDRSRSSKKSGASRIREEKILSASSPIIRNRARRKGQEIFYTPSLNDAPKIDVPVDLPDLPGIVTNIQYAGNNTLIAPSLQLAQIADQLPELETLVATEAKEAPSQDVPLPSVPLPTPPSSSIATVPVVAPPAPPPAPPPPPPPPPPEMLVRKDDESDGATPVKKEPRTPIPPTTPTPVDAHFNLMEAIRNAGGAQKAKLRHSEPKQGRTDSTKPSASTGAGPQNFIDDLHSKLQMRRKGISGARENADQPGNVIDRLSALIPPPPPKMAQEASASESNDEEDWD